MRFLPFASWHSSRCRSSFSASALNDHTLCRGGSQESQSLCSVGCFPSASSDFIPQVSPVSCALTESSRPPNSLDDTPRTADARLHGSLAGPTRSSTMFHALSSMRSPISDVAGMQAATPNHALQRTRAAVTPAASLPHLRPPTTQLPRPRRVSLSLRSLGASLRLV